MVKSVPINRSFKPLYTSKKRYFLLTGGRGSLKSSTVQDFVNRLTFEKGHGILYTRYTMTSAEKSIIPEFKIVAERLGVWSHFKVTKTKITNIKTGSFIYFSGIKTNSGDQTAKLKSIAGITTWVIEEGEDFNDEAAFDTIDDSIRTAGKQNRVIFIMNPTTQEHFIYRRFIKDKNKKVSIEGYDVTVSDMTEVEHIHTTYHVADRLGYLAQSWIDKANKYIDKTLEECKKVKDSLTIDLVKEGKKFKEIKSIVKDELHKIRHTSYYYYNYIGGWLEQAKGVIFNSWQEGMFDPVLPFVHVIDYGFNPDPLAFCKVAVDKGNKKIFIHEWLYDTEVTQDRLLKNIKLVVRKNELIIADHNEQMTTKAVKEKKYNIKKAIKPVIVDSIRAMKGYTIIVTKESSNVKRELNNYVWNDRKASIPVDKFNHLMDCMRYGFTWLTNERRKIKRKN